MAWLATVGDPSILVSSRGALAGPLRSPERPYAAAREAQNLGDEQLAIVDGEVLKVPYAAAAAPTPPATASTVAGNLQKRKATDSRRVLI